MPKAVFVQNVQTIFDHLFSHTIFEADGRKLTFTVLLEGLIRY